EIGVETGGSNVQFAVNPKDGRLIIIEMNPRVSRSSALASKATGFPIAKVAAKLAVGYTLDEIANDITGGATPASFEPTIDYVVTKIPRFAFEKFPGASTTLTTSMKSVGEVMAIGRTFQESLQKALRGLETGLTGLDEIEIEGLGRGDDKNALRAALGTPTPNRIGQGIEFDYCCCHACFALHDVGFESIMINCNPETVSTDYDTADRLYFEPLTAEDVLEIVATERRNGTLHGVIVQFGGQTPLKLARALEAAEVPILGTSPDAIDLAEDRDRFKRVLDKLHLKQPKNGIAYSVEQARLVAAD